MLFVFCGSLSFVVVDCCSLFVVRVLLFFLSPMICYMLIVRCFIPSRYSFFFVVRCLVFVVCCCPLVLVVCCLLVVGGWWLVVLRCLTFGVW